jgi:hypothetical protein
MLVKVGKITPVQHVRLCYAASHNESLYEAAKTRRKQWTSVGLLALTSKQRHNLNILYHTASIPTGCPIIWHDHHEDDDDNDGGGGGGGDNLRNSLS